MFVKNNGMKIHQDEPQQLTIIQQFVWLLNGNAILTTWYRLNNIKHKHEKHVFITDPERKKIEMQGFLETNNSILNFR